METLEQLKDQRDVLLEALGELIDLIEEAEEDRNPETGVVYEANYHAANVRIWAQSIQNSGIHVPFSETAYDTLYPADEPDDAAEMAEDATLTREAPRTYRSSCDKPNMTNISKTELPELPEIRVLFSRTESTPEQQACCQQMINPSDHLYVTPYPADALPLVPCDLSRHHIEVQVAAPFIPQPVEHWLDLETIAAELKTDIGKTDMLERWARAYGDPTSSDTQEQVQVTVQALKDATAPGVPVTLPPPYDK